MNNTPPALTSHSVQPQGPASPASGGVVTPPSGSGVPGKTQIPVPANPPQGPTPLSVQTRLQQMLNPALNGTQTKQTPLPQSGTQAPVPSGKLANGTQVISSGNTSQNTSTPAAGNTQNPSSGPVSRISSTPSNLASSPSQANTTQDLSFSPPAWSQSAPTPAAPATHRDVPEGRTDGDNSGDSHSAATAQILIAQIPTMTVASAPPPLPRSSEDSISWTAPPETSTAPELSAGVLSAPASASGNVSLPVGVTVPQNSVYGSAGSPDFSISNAAPILQSPSLVPSVITPARDENVQSNVRIGTVLIPPETDSSKFPNVVSENYFMPILEKPVTLALNQKSIPILTDIPKEEPLVTAEAVSVQNLRQLSAMNLMSKLENAIPLPVNDSEVFISQARMNSTFAAAQGVFAMLGSVESHLPTAVPESSLHDSGLSISNHPLVESDAGSPAPTSAMQGMWVPNLMEEGRSPIYDPDPAIEDAHSNSFITNCFPKGFWLYKSIEDSKRQNSGFRMLLAAGLAALGLAAILFLAH